MAGQEQAAADPAAVMALADQAEALHQEALAEQRLAAADQVQALARLAER